LANLTEKISMLALSAVIVAAGVTAIVNFTDTTHQSATATPPSGLQTETAPSAENLVFSPPKKVPKGNLGKEILRGEQIFNQTFATVPQFVGDKLNCSSCHLDGGMDENALPLVGASTQFPEYSKRPKSFITLSERVNQCFQRSEGGKALPLGNPDLIAVDTYITWLSSNLPMYEKIPWEKNGADLKPSSTINLKDGEMVFQQVCSTCHGMQGQGGFGPPLWGAESFVKGAGMSKLQDMASFVKLNMPVYEVHGVKPGGLTIQQATDVAAYVLKHPRNVFHA